MNICLKPINEDNFLDAFNLKLGEGQDIYVSHPVRSLAQAYVYRTQCQPFGIYADENIVGYVMVIYDRDIPEYDIWHMMIDAAQQGKGYGKAALKHVLDYIRQKPFGDSDRVALTCNKHNIKALALYRSMGFELTGNQDDDEVELALTLKNAEISRRHNEEAERILAERFGKDAVIALATVADGVPYVRNVDAYYEEGAFYIITHACSNKMKQLEQNPMAAIAGEWFTAHGKAINLGYFGKKENAEIAGKLKKAFSKWIDNGHTDFDDENTIILCIKLTDGILFSNGKRYEIE